MGKILSQDQVDQFNEKGFFSPVEIFSREQAAAYLAQLEQFESSAGRELSKGFNFKPHLLFKWVNEIGRNPRVLDAVEDLIGPNILLFHLTVHPKRANDPAYVNWHQDATYFGLNPTSQITAWVALSDASIEAGCMEMVPGSQKLGQLHHGNDLSEHNMLSRGQTVDVPYDRSHTEFMPVTAGQMSLHDTFVIHASGPNRTNHRRVGLGFSYIPTHARNVTSTRLTASLVRGEDTYAYYDLEPIPQEDNGESERRFHQDAVERFRASNAEEAAKY